MTVSAQATGTHTPPSASIASSTNATPIVVTTGSAHGFSTSDTVYIVGHTTNTAANGTWVITVLSPTTFSLTGSVGNGVGGATGTVLKVVEQDVSDVNVAGVFQFYTSLFNLAAGDVVELRVYQMELTSGTPRVLMEQTFYGAQPSDSVHVVSKPIGNDLTDSQALYMTIKQTYGIARSFTWKVLKFAP